MPLFPSFFSSIYSLTHTFPSLYTHSHAFLPLDIDPALSLSVLLFFFHVPFGMPCIKSSLSSRLSRSCTVLLRIVPSKYDPSPPPPPSPARLLPWYYLSISLSLALFSTPRQIPWEYKIRRIWTVIATAILYYFSVTHIPKNDRSQDHQSYGKGDGGREDRHTLCVHFLTNQNPLADLIGERRSWLGLCPSPFPCPSLSLSLP